MSITIYGQEQYCESKSGFSVLRRDFEGVSTATSTARSDLILRAADQEASLLLLETIGARKRWR